MTQEPNQSPPPDHDTLQGRVPDLASPDARNAAMDQAFDYRGDVTLHTTDGRVIEGYIFDRHNDATEPHVRLIANPTGQRLNIPYSDITRLTFTGRDTAAGKSWEAWLKRYQEKKARGQSADLHPDPLD